MADERELFSVLANSSDGAGLGLAAKIDGNAKGAGGANDNEIGVLPCEDSGGMLRHIPLNDAGDAVQVDSGAAGTCMSATGKVTPTVGVDIDVAVITLTADKVYTDICFSGSNTRTTEIRLVQDNNGTETTIAQFLVGPGQYSYQEACGCLEITAGSTGVQELKVVGNQLGNPASDIRGNVQCLEKA